MSDTRAGDFKVGEWWVRRHLNELRRGGEAVHVEARSIEVLACLARHAPEVVSRDQLITEVWEDSFVGDEVVSHAVWELRKALGDDAREPDYIQTIPRRGYRLIAETTWPVDGAAPDEGARIGHYELLEKIGTGAMGTVYRANDRKLQRTVALKFLASGLTRDEVARRRFLREARLAASLDHPNIGTVHEIGETSGGRQYIVTAYYEKSLKQRLDEGPMPVAEAVRIAGQLAGGLALAHRNDIVHRDVKPANIMLTSDGTAKLVDFGIAKLSGSTRLTRTATSLGTPAYKSPEQSRGEEVDYRTDLWSLGVVFYEALTGRLPFSGEYEHAIIRAILEDPAPPLPEELPPVLGRVVGRALTKEPAERYQDGGEMVRDLEDGADVSAAISSRRGLPGGRRGRLAILAVLALLTIGWLAARGTFQSDEGPGKEQRVAADRFVVLGVREELEGDMKGRLEAAEEFYRRALVALPQDAEIQSRLALVLARQEKQSAKAGRLDEIRKLVEEAVGEAPRHWLTLLAQGRLAFLEERYEEALSSAEDAIRRAPRWEREPADESDRALTLKGRALIRLGQVDHGLSVLREATEVGEGYIRARIALALELDTQGQSEAAEAEYAWIIDNYGEHPVALNNLGQLKRQRGMTTEALGYLKRAIAVDPEPDRRMFNTIANIYYNMPGREADAIEWYEKAIELDSTYPSAYLGLGDTLTRQGELERATEAFETALSLYATEVAEGADIYGRGQWALAAAKLGRYPEALKEIESALAEQPNHARLRFAAARIYGMAGLEARVHEEIRWAVAHGRPLEEFKTNPSFAAYQNDPVFLALLEGGGVE